MDKKNNKNLIQNPNIVNNNKIIPPYKIPMYNTNSFPYYMNNNNFNVPYNNNIPYPNTFQNNFYDKNIQPFNNHKNIYGIGYKKKYDLFYRFLCAFYISSRACFVSSFFASFLLHLFRYN